MNVVHVDTHVAIWMRIKPKRVQVASRHLDGKAIAVSPMVVLELHYMAELGRIAIPASRLLDHLRASVGLVVSESPWSLVVRTAIGLTWTRDPFDRLIAAHALTDGVPLVTADAIMRKHCPNAVWR